MYIIAKTNNRSDKSITGYFQWGTKLVGRFCSYWPSLHPCFYFDMRTLFNLLEN